VANVRQQIPQLAKTATKTLQADCQRLFTSLSGQVMDFLIKAYWYQAEAARDHVKVSDAQVLKAFTTAKNQQFTTNAQYQAFLTQTGQTQQDILFRFRINQIFTKLLAKQNTAVTNAQIQKYYNSHLSQFGTPEARDLRIILTKTAAQASDAKAAISHGKSWAKVVKQYSIDTQTKATGGLLTGVIKGQQDQALDAAAFSAAQGVLVGPIKGPFGYYVFEVVKIHPATQQTLAQATSVIRSTLAQQAQNSASSALDNLAKKHWLSLTKCASAYKMVDCSGYKAPKTTTTPGLTTRTG
jgi:foldase protein PrsA